MTPTDYELNYTKKPTAEERKVWSRKIRIACRTDYRSWVTGWVQRIEAADNKGDTKGIHQGVKALSGSAANSTTRPTEHWHDDEKPVRARESQGTTDGKEKVTDTDGKRKESGRASAAPVRASKAGTRIDSPQELAEIWKEFLGRKFSPTEQERLRAEFEELPESTDPDEELTREEFENAVNK